MFNSCNGDWVNVDERPKIGNFANSGGYTGTRCSSPRSRSTAASSRWPSKLDLCDIKKVATKMGVTLGDGGCHVDR